MSYILEALGKAEKTRKQEHLTELASDLYRPSQRSAADRWLKGVLWVLVPLISFLLGYLARPYIERVHINIDGAPTVNNTAATKTKQAKPTPKLITSNAAVEAVLEQRKSPEVTTQPVQQNDAHTNLTVSVISFSDTATERFAMVNGVIVKEGDTLGSGERVVQIDKTSVLLDRLGQSFVVTLL